MKQAMLEFEALPRDARVLAANLIRVPPSVAHWLGNDSRGSQRRPTWTVQHLAIYFGKSEEAAAQAVAFAVRHNFIEPAGTDQWQFRPQERIMGDAAWN